VLASGGAERVGAPTGRFYHRDLRSGRSLDEAAAFPTHREAISRMLAALLEGSCLGSLAELSCVGFKVVHAKGVTGVQYLTDDVLAKMEAFSSVAPAHNPPYLAAIRLFRALLPETPLVGAFETAFHASMPPEAALYGIPLEVSRKYAIRRYGFHGASLEYLSEWTAARMNRRDAAPRRLPSRRQRERLRHPKRAKHRHQHGPRPAVRHPAEQPLRRSRSRT
jgi:acetate kinase